MPEYLFPASDKILEYCELIVTEMTATFGMSRAEAVARINCQWRGQDFSGGSIILHAMPGQLAHRIYFEDFYEDGRLQHRPRVAPQPDSECWTVPLE